MSANDQRRKRALGRGVRAWALVVTPLGLAAACGDATSSDHVSETAGSSAGGSADAGGHAGSSAAGSMNAGTNAGAAGRDEASGGAAGAPTDLGAAGALVTIGTSGMPAGGEGGAATALPDPHASCRNSYLVAGKPNTDLAAVLQACPELATALLWVDAKDQDVAYANWPAALQKRLAVFYQAMLTDSPLPNFACPDPRVADRERVVTSGGGDPKGTPIQLFFTQAQGEDTYLASVAHSLALEIRSDLPWSLLDYPTAELEPLFSARSLLAPVSQAPRPFGTALPNVGFQVPLAHDGFGFVCDPRDGYGFARGTSSKSHADLLGATPNETLAKLTQFVADNTVHGFPLGFLEPIDSFQFTLSERLHKGLDEPGATASATLIERWGCHSTAELLEELARAVNVPLLAVASYAYDWTDGTDYGFRNNTHRGFVYAWTRPAERRILPHADFINATGLTPSYKSGFGAQQLFDLVWRTPESYQAMGLKVDMTLPVVPILPKNSDGAFETYFDFGRVLSVLGDEGRYYLRTEACAWDLARAFCINPTGDATAFAANNPSGGYPEFSTPALLQAALAETKACLTALPGGCSNVPSSFPNRVASNYWP